MLFPILQRRGKVVLFPKVFRTVRTNVLSMAASNDEDNKENVANGEAEQIVTMEKVVAADNKGIDYDKLISKCLFQFLFIVLSVKKAIKCPRQGPILNKILIGKVIRAYTKYM